jgi:hypothetical protein
VTNPYLITGPALISFSGGRTSAFMLRQILDAHGGTLPDDVVVAFANTGKERWTSLMPMAKARHTKRDVMAFWAAQDFDLGMKDYEGNCDLCFLKSRGKLEQIIRDEPGRAEWWSRMERGLGKGRFVTEYSYADLAAHVARSPALPGILHDEEFDTECGLHCAAE